MPRKPRIEYEGAVYHVMNRGDRGGKVFKDELDYSRFMKATEQVCERTGWRIHAYVLMPNHFHWLLETPAANLVAGMKWFLGAYSQGFNARHGQRGHVFQGRYKAIPIESESGGYFETVSTYIHLNPARAHMLGESDPLDLGAYSYSSYGNYIQPRGRRSAWLSVERVLGDLGLNDDTKARREYAKYMRERVSGLRKKEGRKAYREEWKPLRYGWCLGGEAFEERLLGRIETLMEENDRKSYSGVQVCRHDEREAEALLKKGMGILGVTDNDLGSMKKNAPVKRALACYVHSATMAKHSWIADRLHMGSLSNLSRYISDAREAGSGELARLRNALEES